MKNYNKYFKSREAHLCSPCYSKDTSINQDPLQKLSCLLGMHSLQIINICTNLLFYVCRLGLYYDVNTEIRYIPLVITGDSFCYHPCSLQKE